MRATVALIACWGLALFAGCGKNEVTIEIRGGDGRKVRLDANDVEYKFNRLVDAGSYTFPRPDSKIELDERTYVINVVAGDYLHSHSLQVESPPITGVENYRVEFDIPAGSNGEFSREGTILFASTPTNVRDWDLFTIRADASELTQLTNTKEFEQYPSWSPDGERILFTRGSVMTNIDIFVMDANGSHITRLTEHPERDERAIWSPDGTTIAYVSQRDGDVAIWLMDIDGGNKRKLVKGREPSWSPDSEKIAFVSFVSGQFDGNDEIYLIDLDGSNMRRLTNTKKSDWFPQWSPEGSRLAFCTERFGGQELMVANVETGSQVRITMAKSTFEENPVWSPDGRGLAYQGKMNFTEEGELDVEEYMEGRWRPRGTYDIFLVPVVGFDWDETESPPIMPINLTNTPDRDEKSPSWRPF